MKFWISVFLIGLLASAKAQDPACGSTTNIRELLDNPPPNYGIPCITRPQVVEFLDSEDLVEGLVECFVDGDCDKPGYSQFIAMAQQALGTSFQCNSLCGNNAKLVNWGARQFQSRYPELFREILSAFQL